LEMFKSFCKASGNQGSLFFVLDIAWLTMMESALGAKANVSNEASVMTETTGSVSVAHGSISRSQLIRLVQTIFSTYIFSPDHSVVPIGLSPASLKRLALRADAKGKVKYAPGFFKSAASEVRRFIETDVVPSFKSSAHFRALFTLMNTTSQISFPSQNEITFYACPVIDLKQLKKEEEGKEGSSESEGEEKEEGEDKTKADDFISRLPLCVSSLDAIESLVEEEKVYQKKNVDASISSLPSAEGQSSSKVSLPSTTGSQAGSRSKLRSVSPFNSLLPSRRKTPTAGEEEESDESADGKKGSDWMKRSFILTSKKEGKGSGSEGEE